MNTLTLWTETQYLWTKVMLHNQCSATLCNEADTYADQRGSTRSSKDLRTIPNSAERVKRIEENHFATLWPSLLHSHCYKLHKRCYRKIKIYINQQIFCPLTKPQGVLKDTTWKLAKGSRSEKWPPSSWAVKGRIQLLGSRVLWKGVMQLLSYLQ